MLAMMAVWQQRLPGKAVLLLLGCSELPQLSHILQSASAAPMSSDSAPSGVSV